MRWVLAHAAVRTRVLTILIFVPIKYVYPSRTEVLWYSNMTFATAWLGAFAVIVALLPDVPLWLTVLSLAYPAYYLALSLWLTWWPPNVKKREDAAAAQAALS